MAQETKTSGTSWTSPTTGYITVECWGGGGAGGGNATTADGGGGGGGGAYAKSVILVTTGSISYSIGAAGTANAGADGGNGGDTTWATTVVVAKGGVGGKAPVSGAGGVAGTGGLASGSTGNIATFDGGWAETGENASAGDGGYGGSSGGSASDGFNNGSAAAWSTVTYPTGSTPTGAGHGGNGGTASGGAGSAPVANNYGGGGGGAGDKVNAGAANTAGGAGATGKIVITYQPNLTPTQGDGTITGYAPSLKGGRTIVPTAGAAAIAGYAPTLVVNISVRPSAGSLSIDSGWLFPKLESATAGFGGAPGLLFGLNLGILTDRVFTPDAGQLSLTGYAPSLKREYVFSPAAGQLAVAGYAPSLRYAFTLRPAAGALTIDGYAPALLQALLRQPGAGSLTLTGQAPTLTYSYTVTPAAGQLTVDAAAVTALDEPPGTITRAPDAGNLTLAGHAPTLWQALKVLPGAGALSVDGYALTLWQALTVYPGATALSVDGYAPTPAEATPGGDVLREPDAASATITGHAPAVLETILLRPSAGQLEFSSGWPTIKIESATAGTGGSPGLLFGLLLTEALAKQPAATGLTLTGFAPSLKREYIFTPAAGALTISGSALFVEDSGGSLQSDVEASTLGITGQVLTLVTGKTVTFPFLSTQEGFTASPGAGTSMVWTAFGNPAGALQTSTTGTNRSANNYWRQTTDWISLGIPPNSVITGISAGSIQGRLTAATRVRSGTFFAAIITPTGYAPITVAPSRPYTTLETVFTTQSGGSTTGLQLPSGGTIQIEFGTNLRTGNTGTAVAVQDNLTFKVSYTGSKVISPATGQLGITSGAHDVDAPASVKLFPAATSLDVTPYVPVARDEAGAAGAGAGGPLLLFGLLLDRAAGVIDIPAASLSITAGEVSTPTPIVLLGWDDLYSERASLTSASVRVVTQLNPIQEPTAGSLTLAGHAPTITPTANRWNYPALGAPRVTGYAPTLTYSWVIRPDPASLSVEGLTPAAPLASRVVYPAAASLGITGYTPPLSERPAFSVDASELSLGGNIPYVFQRSHVALNASAGAAEITGHAPTLVRGLLVYPAAGTLSLTSSALNPIGAKTWNGSGALQARPATLSGSGSVKRYGSGTLQSPSPRLSSGTGIREVSQASAPAALQSGRATLQGAARTGNGFLQSGPAVLLGRGRVTSYEPPTRRVKPVRVNRYTVALKPSKRLRIKQPNTRKPQR